MMSVIKAASAGALSPVRTLAAAAQPSPIDVELAKAHQRIADLESALDRSLQDTRTLTAKIEEARDQGYSKGHAAGVADADRLERDRLALLASNMNEAQSSLAAALDGVERLAALITRDCLDKLLGQPDFRKEIVHGLICAQIAQMGEDAVLSVTVSARDFGDQAALTALEQSLGTRGTQIDSDQALASGDCVIDLRLGRIDASLTRQWTALGALLTEIGEERVEA